jgi:hypothetical protein
MRTVIKISKHLENITNENLFNARSILIFGSTESIVWKGSKRFAH